MKFHDPDQYEILAAEYVLGTLSGPARRRFEHYLGVYPFLRRAVDEWSARFNSVVERLEPVEPPPRLWDQICEANPELRKRFQPEGLWASLNLWRPLALLASALAVLLVVYLNYGPRVPETLHPTQIAMINDPKAQQPAWILGLMPEQRMLKVTAMHTTDMGPDKSFELWMLPGKNQAPMSLGVLPMNGTAMMPMSDEKIKFLVGSSGLAVSLEPKGGSPTGVPTGPVMYQGALYSI